MTSLDGGAGGLPEVLVRGRCVVDRQDVVGLRHVCLHNNVKVEMSAKVYGGFEICDDRTFRWRPVIISTPEIKDKNKNFDVYRFAGFAEDFLN